MLRIASIITLVGFAILLSNGCDRKSPTKKSNDTAPQADAASKHSPDDGHDHAKADPDDHAGHDHGEADPGNGHGHGHGGKRHELGRREIAGFTVEVVQFGAATDNAAELVFQIDVQGEPAPTAVRLLVRAPDGAESLKVKADKGDDHAYHAHMGELPNKLGEGSVLVVELETPSGTKELMFPLKI
jgi:hypothetical protein